MIPEPTSTSSFCAFGQLEPADAHGRARVARCRRCRHAGQRRHVEVLPDRARRDHAALGDRAGRGCTPGEVSAASAGAGQREQRRASASGQPHADLGRGGIGEHAPQRQRGRSAHGRLGPERRRQQPRDAPLGREHVRLELARDRRRQPRRELGEEAAEHDGLEVQEVGRRGDPDARASGRPRAARRAPARRPCARASASSATGSPEPVVVAASLGSSPAISSSASRPASVSRQPRLPHAHGRPFGSSGHVAELAAEALRAAEQLAAHDDPGADADLAGHVEHVAAARARSPPTARPARRGWPRCRPPAGTTGRTAARAARRPPRRRSSPGWAPPAARRWRRRRARAAPPSRRPAAGPRPGRRRAPSLASARQPVEHRAHRPRGGCRARRGCGGARRR